MSNRDFEATHLLIKSSFVAALLEWGRYNFIMVVFQLSTVHKILTIIFAYFYLK